MRTVLITKEASFASFAIRLYGRIGGNGPWIVFRNAAASGALFFYLVEVTPLNHYHMYFLKKVAHLFASNLRTTIRIVAQRSWNAVLHDLRTSCGIIFSDRVILLRGAYLSRSNSDFLERRINNRQCNF